MNGLQCPTSGKGHHADFFDRIGQICRCQRRAALEGIASHFGQTFGQLYPLQGCTSFKCAAEDSDTCRNCRFCQSRTATKDTMGQLFQTIGQCDMFKGNTSAKGRCSDRTQATGQADLPQCRTALKKTGRDFDQTFGQGHFGQTRTSAEGTDTNLSKALGQSNGIHADAILKGLRADLFHLFGQTDLPHITARTAQQTFAVTGIKHTFHRPISRIIFIHQDFLQQYTIQERADGHFGNTCRDQNGRHRRALISSTHAHGRNRRPSDLFGQDEQVILSLIIGQDITLVFPTFASPDLAQLGRRKTFAKHHAAKLQFLPSAVFFKNLFHGKVIVLIFQ